MFKKFIPDENISGHSQVKTSVQRNIKKKILVSYPCLKQQIDIIFPKKEPMFVTKCHNHVNLVVNNQGQAWFFNERERNYLPTLKTLHKFPNLLPKVQVDRGAIKYVLQGANIMCPGLTSPGGDISAKIPKGTSVAIMAENKKHALGIGITTMSTENMKAINKGIAINNLHCLMDGLWQVRKFE